MPEGSKLLGRRSDAKHFLLLPSFRHISAAVFHMWNPRALIRADAKRHPAPQRRTSPGLAPCSCPAMQRICSQGFCTHLKKRVELSCLIVDEGWYIFKHRPLIADSARQPLLLTGIHCTHSSLDLCAMKIRLPEPPETDLGATF